MQALAGVHSVVPGGASGRWPRAGSARPEPTARRPTLWCVSVMCDATADCVCGWVGVGVVGWGGVWGGGGGRGRGGGEMKTPAVRQRQRRQCGGRLGESTAPMRRGNGNGGGGGRPFVARWRRGSAAEVEDPGEEVVSGTCREFLLDEPAARDHKRHRLVAVSQSRLACSRLCRLLPALARPALSPSRSPRLLRLHLAGGHGMACRSGIAAAAARRLLAASHLPPPIAASHLRSPVRHSFVQ